MPSKSSNQTVQIRSLSNQEFLEGYAAPGRIGLSGGPTITDKVISHAQRGLDATEGPGGWSHVFVCQGRRLDGHHWILESDLQLHHKHIRFGVQENRLSKYYDETLYTQLAFLDFGLNETQIAAILSEGLELVAQRTEYSLRELVGTLIAIRQPNLRKSANVLARENSMFCSAFTQHVFRKAGLDLAPGVDVKNTAPDDIARATAPHTTYLMQRAALLEKVSPLAKELRRSVRQGESHREKAYETALTSPSASGSESLVAFSAASSVA